MSRRTWPRVFLLQTGDLAEAFDAQRAAKAVEAFYSKDPEKHNGVPIALRWMTRPALGFPRQPFQVWRRPTIVKPPTRLTTAPVTVNGSTRIEWGGREMFELAVQVAPTAGQTVTIEALDFRFEAIPGQRIVFTANRVGLLRGPGMVRLRATGQGTITVVIGTDAITLANDPKWERIDTVGLPYKKSEAAPPVYTPTPQGPEPAALDGQGAAKMRLAIAAILQLDPPTTGVADIPTPGWPVPDPGEYLEKVLRAASPSPLKLIDECLRNSDDTNPSKLQSKYIHHATLKGIRQADISGSTPGPDPTEAELPVVAVIGLSTSSDSFASTGLGYGTVDFPPKTQGPNVSDFLMPPGAVVYPFDYMVTAEFVLPLLGKLELAALGSPVPRPEAATGMTAARIQLNRPAVRDAGATESVLVSWNLSTFPEAYAVGVSHKPNNVGVLNGRRRAIPGFDPFVPTRPAALPPGGRAEFTHPIAPVPMSGSLTSRYVVAGLDVFGRWSAWAVQPYTSTALPVEQPGIHRADILPDGSLAVGHSVPANMEIEFSWDWTDRTLDRVIFTGKFFPKAGVPDPAFTAGFALTQVGAPGPPVVASFNALGQPLITSGHSGTVELLDSTLGDPQRRKYTLTLRGMTCDFGVDHELAYELYVRAAEKVRPAELSALLGPKTTHVFDPLPPVVPTIPVDLRWTALPDANRVARGVLSWPASPGALGYVVWEASEAHLRVAADPASTTPPPGAPTLARAASLQALVTASSVSQARSLQAFSRMRDKLIKDTSLEVELPGSADSIFAYRVSAVSQNNQESPRSAMAMFAVPRRNVPGQPKLLLRVVNTAPRGIDIIALPGSGATTVGFRVHRVRNSALLADVGLMGPPKIEPSDPGWSPHTVTKPDGTVVGVGMAILDEVAPSWAPYYYALVAIGKEDLASGEYAGESPASAAQSAVLPPENPPLLDSIAQNANATNRVIRFRTDLPVKPCPLGKALIQIVQIAPDADGKTARTTILSVEPPSVKAGTLKVLPSPTAEQLAAMPEIRRKGPDAAGRSTFTVRAQAEVKAGAIVLTDPLGRTTEAPF